MVKYSFLFVCVILSFVTASQKVVLIHGFGSNLLVMAPMEYALRQKGLTVTNYSYNSLYTDLDTLGKQLYYKCLQLSEDTISFVTHSMGALVVRSMYNYVETTKDFPDIYRIVMLAPPNKGAEVADFFSSNPVINALAGPNVAKMRTDTGSYANRLPLPRCSEAGIIVGVKRKGFWFNRESKKSSDGYLTPQRAELGIEKELAVVNQPHTLISLKQVVIDLTCSFLMSGSFINTDKE